MRCNDCPNRTVVIKYKGNINAEIVIVGEAPGKQDIRTRELFSGDPGDLLWNACPEGDPTLDANDVFITTAHQCASVGKKDEAKSNAKAKACSERLMAEIDHAPRKIIFAMGNPALRSLTGNYNLKITKERGKLIQSPLASIGIIPIINPGALLMGSGSYRQFREDIEYGFALARGERGPKQAIIPTVIVHDDPWSVFYAMNMLLEHDGIIAADLETEGLNYLTDAILCMGISIIPEEVHVFPDSIFHLLGPLFEAKHAKWCWQNGKFDIKFLWKYGYSDARVDEDTMLLSYVQDETGGIHGLEQIASDVLGSTDWKYMIDKYLPKKDSSYALVPRDVLYKYLGYDASDTLQIFNIYRPRVKANKDLEKLYTKLMIPASNMLARVERNGFTADMEQNALMDVKYLSIIEEKKAIVQGVAGYKINPNSNPQIQKLFYDELKFKRKPRKGRSCDAEVLEWWPKVPIVMAMRAYRKAHKMHSTYVKGCRKAVQADGKVHTTFKLYGTKTGRLASSNPNMQNQPRLTEIKSQYRASAGRILIELDLNQAELRSLATVSRCKELLKIYNDPTSIGLHNELSIELFGPDFTGEEKMRAKAVNFGIVYGREARSLADEFGISLEEAQRWIDGWATRFPGAWDFIQKCRRAPATGATITTHFGRKKRHHLVTKARLKDFQNEAANFPHQAIASDITLDCAIQTQDILEFDLDTFIINLVHDSNILDAPDDPKVLRQIYEYCKPTWEAVPPKWGLRECPFIVEMKTGYRWGDLEEYKYEELAA